MAGTAMAVVEFYSTFEPNIVSWNFPGTSENPTTIKAGEFKPEVTVKMDEDTEVDMQASTGQVDGSGNWAVYWDYSRDPGKVWIGNVVTAVGQTHHIKINIVFKRSNGTTYTRTAEGYVTGGDVKGRWYLDQYDLSALGTYEVLKIPLTGSVTLKFAATEGAPEQGVRRHLDEHVDTGGGNLRHVRVRKSRNRQLQAANRYSNLRRRMVQHKPDHRHTRS